MTPDLQWQPLEMLDARFRANLAALETQHPALAGRLRSLTLARPFFIAARGDAVFLGRPGEAGIEVLPDPVPAMAARRTATSLFPNDVVNRSIVVGGLGYGWLWDRIAKLPCRVETAVGHRPPIYLLAADIEQLWAVLHVMEWQQILADPRFLIFAGMDATRQLREALVANPMLPRPQLCLCIDAPLWQETDFNALLESVVAATEQRLAGIRARLANLYAHTPVEGLAERFRNGRLRILGITSRYTTFLQHSTRDWLAALERLGHDVTLFIESHDHLVPGHSGFAQAVLDARPDLIVVIDHYRAELGYVPESVPCVMWVQDCLPNIYKDAAGAAQGPRDFCIGFGRLPLTLLHGYPAERFMACPIGINEERFQPAVLTDLDRARYGCDVSYVSHASTPSDVLLREALTQSPDPSVARLVWDLHDRLVGDFEAGGVTHAEWQLKRKLDESVARTGVKPNAKVEREILWLFNQQINNAIFRHQALKWVADLGVELKIYGKGWEKHPTLGRFACGPADTVRDVPKIYAASKVNLQITPHGAVHQRLLEGLVAGGFFLMRWTPGDQLGVAFRSLLDWCKSQGIRNESELRSVSNPQVQTWIAECDELRVDHAKGDDFRLYDRLFEGGEAELAARAGAVWPEEYPQVSFRSAAELQSKLSRFLGDEQKRMRLASAMRGCIVENFTYASISKRMIQFIAADLRAAGQARSAAA